MVCAQEQVGQVSAHASLSWPPGALSCCTPDPKAQMDTELQSHQIKKFQQFDVRFTALASLTATFRSTEPLSPRNSKLFGHNCFSGCKAACQPSRGSEHSESMYNPTGVVTHAHTQLGL